MSTLPQTHADPDTPRFPDAGDGVELDPRIASVLAWCRRENIGDMTIAAPFRLSSAELRALLVLADVMSAVTTSPLPSDIDATSLGTFSPAEYS